MNMEGKADKEVLFEKFKDLTVPDAFDAIIDKAPNSNVLGKKLFEAAKVGKDFEVRDIIKMSTREGIINALDLSDSAAWKKGLEAVNDEVDERRDTITGVIDAILEGRFTTFAQLATDIVLPLEKVGLSITDINPDVDPDLAEFIKTGGLVRTPEAPLLEDEAWQQHVDDVREREVIKEFRKPPPLTE
jgi:hypothetical protein